MREIEFRGKYDLSSEFTYGDLIHGVGTKSNKMYILPNVINLAKVKNCHPLDGVSVLTETIGQYTGLKDKNGTKIFENDIVKWGHVAGGLEIPLRIARVDLFPSLQFEIIQNRKQFFKRTFEYGSFMYQNTEKYLEVIGNIHNNPELLKGE